MSQKNLTLFDLAPGKTILDRYTIRRANRHGGMAATFEVEDNDDHQTCELQVFPAALFEDSEQANDFAQEMRSWGRVSSPAVLRLRQVASMDDGTTVLVTDFPKGGSLRDWLSEHGRMDPERVATIGLALLDGLIEVHAADLVHGDIKPNTIHADEEPILVDGGITTALWGAKHLGDRTTLIGTPVYAPIEQFGGDAPNVQSDVYNLAAVLFELVTGCVPWKGKGFLEVFQSKLDKAAPSMQACASDVDVSPELEAAIVGGMMADRKERYTTAAEFRERLAAVG